jgi:site-specific recombinase XerD
MNKNYTVTTYIRLERTREDGYAPLYFRIILNMQRLKFPLKEYVLPQYWNQKKQEYNKPDDSGSVNGVILQKKTEIITAIHQLKMMNSDFTIDNLKFLLEGEELNKTYYLLACAEEHNLEFEQQIGSRYSYGSFKNYKTTLCYLREFIKEKFDQKDIPLKNVNHRFCELFFIWLTTKKPCNQNGGAKHIQRLKKYLNYSIKMGYITVNPITSYTIKLKSVNRVALTWDEIKTLQQLSLHDKTLMEIRDVFLFQIYTGLAYADVKKVSNKEIINNPDGSWWLKMEREKTRSEFMVPLLDIPLKILHFYYKEYNISNQPILPVLSNQKYNDRLKILQGITGIRKNLHTHLARHTFATTITLLMGVPIETVSKMLGHSKITMTQIYAKTNELKVAVDMKGLQGKIDDICT